MAVLCPSGRDDLTLPVRSNAGLYTSGAPAVRDCDMFASRIPTPNYSALLRSIPLPPSTGLSTLRVVLGRLRHLVLIALLVVIPGQGTAALLHAFTCEPHAVFASTGGAEHVSYAHDHTAASDHEQDVAHNHGQHAGQAGGDLAQDQCCHQVPGAPTVYIAPAPRGLPVYLSFPPVLELSFVLEQPQRPPRA